MAHHIWHRQGMTNPSSGRLRLLGCTLGVVLLWGCAGGEAEKKNAMTLGGEGSIAAVSRVAQTMAGAGDCVTALKFFGQVLEKDPKNTSARLGSAMCEARLGNMAVAVSLYEGLLTDDPNNKMYLESLGKAYLYHGDSGRCADPLGKALAHNQDDPSTLNSLGVCYDLRGDHDQAQTYYEKALAVQPDHPGIQSNLGLSYLLSQKTDQGMAILNRLVTRPGATPRDRHNLAFAVGIQGNMEDASKFYSYDLKPDEVRQNLAYIHRFRTLMGPITAPNPANHQAD